MPMSDDMSEEEKELHRRRNFIRLVLFGIARNVKLPDHRLTFEAESLGFEPTTLRKLEDLVWQSDVRDKNGEITNSL